jgi:hypothetical protein
LAQVREGTEQKCDRKLQMLIEENLKVRLRLSRFFGRKTAPKNGAPRIPLSGATRTAMRPRAPRPAVRRLRSRWRGRTPPLVREGGLKQDAAVDAMVQAICCDRDED